jgi:cysteine synthase
MIHDDIRGTVRDAWLVRLTRLAGVADGTHLIAAVSAPGTSPVNADAVAAHAVADLESSGALDKATTLVCCGARFGASIAQHAAALGLKCIVLLGGTTPRAAKNGIAALGAEIRVIPVPENSETRGALFGAARRVASNTPGAVLVDKRREGCGRSEERFGASLVEAVGDSLHAVVGVERDALLLEGVRRAQAAAGRGGVMMLSFDGVAWVGDAGGTPVHVSETDALTTARRLAREEGILGGSGNGGATVAAALRLLHEAPSGATVVALVPAADEGDLLTTYDPAWWAEHYGDDADGSLTAGDILARKHDGPDDLVTLAPDDTVVEAIRLMRDLEVSQIPVLDDGRIVGTIREDQVIDLLLHTPERKEGPVASVMEDGLPELDESASVDDLQSLLVRGGSAVIVHRADGTRDILTKYDLIHALARG